MLCPRCLGELSAKDTISRPNENYRARQCKSCGYKFYTKESICDEDEAKPLFVEWSRERTKKAEAKKRGEHYEVHFADGRENKPTRKETTRRLF